MTHDARAVGQPHEVSMVSSRVPRCSIVMPTYRRPTFLARAVASIMQQTMPHWELLIVDDNEPDSSARTETESLVARLMADDPRVHYIRHPRNLGGGAARNTGIRATSSPFVAFLDDDDVWHREKLERQLDRLEMSPPHVALVYCRMRVEEAVTGRTWLWPTKGDAHSMRDLMMRNTIGSTSCVICRRAALEAVGAFDENLPSRQDVDLYVRLAERYDFAFVDETLMTLHRHGRPSISNNYDGAIEAHYLFFEKHRRRIESDPEILHARLYALGYLLVAAERYGEARVVLVRAWRVRPLDRAVLLRLALTVGIVRRLAMLVRRTVPSAWGGGRE